MSLRKLLLLVALGLSPLGTASALADGQPAASEEAPGRAGDDSAVLRSPAAPLPSGANAASAGSVDDEATTAEAAQAPGGACPDGLAGSPCKLRDSALEALESAITWVIMGIMLLVLMWGMLGHIMPVLRMTTRVRRGTSGLSGRAETPERAKALAESILEPLPVFRDVWRGFRDRLTSWDGHLRAQRPYSELISADDVADRAGAAAASRIPTVFTTLGLLGTFLGIAEALAKVASRGEASAITQNINSAIPGLAAAFWSSIAGVVLALLFGRWANGAELKLRSAAMELRAAVDALFPTLAAEEVLARQLQVLEALRTESHRDNVVLQGTLDRVSSEAEEARGFLQTIANDLPDKLGARFQRAMQEHIQPGLAALQESLDARLAGMAGDSADAARSFASEAADAIGAQLTAGLEAVGQSLRTFSAGFDAMSTRIEGLGSAVTSVMQSHAGSLTETRAVLDRAREQSTASTRVVQTIEGALERVNVAMRGVDLARSQTDALVARQSDAQGRHVAVTAQLLERLEAAVRVYVKTADALAPVVGGIGASVESLAGSVARVSSASETAGARLEGVATQLGTRLQKEMELVGTYSRAVGEMDAALGRARPTLDHLANAASKAHDAASRFQSVGESAVAIADRLTKTADTLKGELVVAATALEGAGSKLGGAAAATEAWSDKARSAIEKFGQETSRVIQDSLHLYDDSLTGAVRALKASMHEIEDLAEEIAGRRRGPQPTPPGPARPSSPSVTGSGLRR